MGTSFCHIHNHTEYSLLDGANRIPDMVRRAAELGMGALAITDHGVMFGVMEFSWQCKENGVKPLIGVEAYVAPQGMANRTAREERSTYHLLLLAKDLEGYRNLCQISTIAALQGYYYKPRVDHRVLEEHSKGVIATSACIGSEVCQALLTGSYERAVAIADKYRQIFTDGFFIELQDHRLPAQRRIKADLIKIAKDLNIPLVATNDAHYLCKQDHEAHDLLLCIQTGRALADTTRMRFETNEFYLKSQEEMEALFKDTPDALSNTALVAEMCNVELGKQRANMPLPELPEGETSGSYLRKLCEENLPKRVKGADESSLARLHFELDVIKKTGFEDYFLLVREFANAARDRGIQFGVRGSAAGSLVSYCIGITEVDPLKYDITFERFLNPERISMPDIDMDFEDARRDEIIKFVTEKYGQDHVAQIITFGTMGPKAAIRDCGRAMGTPPGDVDRLCKTIPNVPGMTLETAYKEISDFRQLVDKESKLQTLLTMAKAMEGRARHAGVHAAGIVISRDPLVEHVPLFRGSDGQAVTAFEKGVLEKIGLLKMDFLGLSNLTVLSRVVEAIRERLGKEVDLLLKDPEDRLNRDDLIEISDGDEATYAMLARGETTGVFQLEGGGMTNYLMQLKPQSVQELAAMVALYRPGPMKHLPTYIATKLGRTKVDLLDPRMEPVLRETYGVIVYQDQVLKLVQTLAGFSLGKADILRKAMGSKNAETMASLKTEFTDGARSGGMNEKAAHEVWELLLPFAGYAFNKAHAVCYALLAYQTAFLKANYPVEFMAALLGAFHSKEDRVVAFIDECRRMRIPVLPPDLNASEVDFAIEGGGIRFGLAAIKGVGEGLVASILAEREANGPFVDFYEFCARVRPAGLTKVGLQALVKSGAFNCIERNRNRMLDVLDEALSYADEAVRERLAGQESLFGGDAAQPAAAARPSLPLDVTEVTRSEILAMEKEVMGIYVSDHPLRGYENALRRASDCTCSQVAELDDGEKVQLAGVIASVRNIVTRQKAERMATFVLEDFTGQATVIVFPAVHTRVRDDLAKDALVQVVGFATHRERLGERSVEIRMDSMEPLEPILDLDVKPGDSAALGLVRLRVRKSNAQQLEALLGVVREHPGSYDLLLQIMPEDVHPPIRPPYPVNPNNGFRTAVEAAVPRCEIEVIPYTAFEVAPETAFDDA